LRPRARLPDCANAWRWLALSCVIRNGIFCWLDNWCSGIVKARFENLPDVVARCSASADSL
jgi:hypothetical protein